MEKFEIAIVSSSDPKNVAGILSVWAKDIRDALKRVRKDPDMENVRCYPAAKSLRFAKADTEKAELTGAVAALA